MKEYKPLEARIKADKTAKIIKIALLGVVFIVLCVISFPRCLLWQRIVIGILTAIFLFLYVLKTGIIRQCRDTSWEGTVEGHKIKHAANKNLNTRDMRVRLVCIWFVTKDDGNKIKLKYDTEEITEGYFAPGDRIRHTAGARYPTRATVTNHNYICPMCGHASSEPHCSFCRTDYASVYDKPDVWDISQSLFE